MNQDKFGRLIKELRKKNNLTQKDLAEKYNVTYQAVSKWERGINMPDISLIKQISKDFDISLEELIDGEVIKNKKNRLFIILFLILLVSVIGVIIFIFNKEDDFEFKTLSSSCNNFTITGNIAYNKNKSSIYITNIEYCGDDKNLEFNNIECSLYENNGNIEKKISSYNYNKNNNIRLEDFLNDLTFVIDDYDKLCDKYEEDSLYLLIDAKDKDNKNTTFKIPLTVNTCNK